MIGSNKGQKRRKTLTRSSTRATDKNLKDRNPQRGTFGTAFFLRKENKPEELSKGCKKP
jgi:hypothetical protein